MLPNDEILMLNGVTLTTDYADNTSLAYEYRSGCGLSVYVKYARDDGSATAYAQFQVETSSDGAVWIPHGVWSNTGGVETFTPHTYKIAASGNKPLFLDEVRCRWFRVKINEADVTGAFYGVAKVWAYKSDI